MNLKIDYPGLPGWARNLVNGRRRQKRLSEKLECGTLLALKMKKVVTTK